MSLPGPPRWRSEGSSRYPDASQLILLADCGGSNSYRARAWKYALQHRFYNVHQLPVTVARYPAGCSKWNPIEHRLFSEISRNWSGCPLESFDLILNYIASTTTRTGLVVTSRLNRNEYPAGIQISDEQMEALNITRNNEPIPKVELQHLSLSKLTSYFCAPPKESVATVRPSPNRLSRRYRGPSVSICPAGRKIFLGTAGRSKNRQPAWLRRSHAAQAPCSRLSHLTTIQPPDPG